MPNLAATSELLAAGADDWVYSGGLYTTEQVREFFAAGEILIPSAFKELFAPRRYKVFWGGRGGAKSWGYADALLVLGVMGSQRVLCARELQVSINDSVHKLLCDRIAALRLDEFWHITNTSIRSTINDSEFLFKGLRHNATEIKSLEGIDKAWVEEAEKVSDSSWELLIPTIRKRGSEIWVGFNAKNPTDATYRRFVQNAGDDVLVRKVNWRENPFFPVELNKERLKLLVSDPEAYEHIWEGGFDTRHSGAVYAKWIMALYEAEGGAQINDRVVWDEAFPVYTAWDLGYDDSTAIWFYQLGYGELFVIDYYENNGEGIGHYCEVLKNKPYSYGEHFVPHDAANKVMAAGGRSILEQAMKDYGIKMYVIPATSQMNSIESLRKTLPRCWFNKTKCSDGLDALMQYSFQYDENLQTFKSTPIHNWSSHAADAAEIMGRMWQNKVVSVKEIADRKQVQKFYKLQKQYGNISTDPYRVKPGVRRTK